MERIEGILHPHPNLPPSKGKGLLTWTEYPDAEYSD